MGCRSLGDSREIEQGVGVRKGVCVAGEGEAQGQA